MIYKTAQKGFTLIELLVVVGIIGVIMSVTITGQNMFGSSTMLSSTAYDISLSIRQAQSYGLAGKGGVSYGYGIDFNHDTEGKYIFFADSYPTTVSTCYSNNPNEPTNAPSVKHGDCMFTKATEGIQTFKINNGIRITDFCVYKGTQSYCTNSGSNPISKLDISFARPKTNAVLYARDSNSVIVSSADRACIKISKSEGSRYIIVEKVGTIRVSHNPSVDCTGI